MYKVERDFHGKKLVIETGRIAKQTSGTAVVKCGDSVVMVTACIGEPKDYDFFPLTIDYVEKTYAAGKIPGGYFKREGKLSDRETLTSRLIDRPCRPLFPKEFKVETQIVATVLSHDPEVPTDVLALCGASAALTISEIPFEGPVAGVRVCSVDDQLVINPSFEQAEKAKLNFIIAGTADAITMVEGGAQIVPEEEVLDALFYAHEEMQVIIEMQNELRKQCGKAKIEVAPAEELNPEWTSKINAFLDPKILAALTVKDKMERKAALKALKQECYEDLCPDPENDEDADEKKAVLGAVMDEQVYNQVRKLAFDKKVRIDGRDFETVRQIDIELGLLPRSHGSALFTRGETQGIVTATLGVAQDGQRIETLNGEVNKSFMLHYNFPPFSVGEARPMRGPGRREIGHGTLAERAVQAILPDAEDNPYVIRIVSEITESNGSSSMATVCGSSLALMDAGVKIKAPVAGVAMGLLNEGENFAVLTDILGDEDHLGDMDFKVCGTEEGITALQMDIKIKGLKKEVMKKAMAQAREARLHILLEMGKAISEPREDVSDYAPRIEVFKISKNRIRDLIGTGGKNIRSIIEAHDISVNVDDDGTVTVAGTNKDNMASGIKVIKAMTAEAEVGKIYQGVVKRLANFGAFVEILPGIDGLLHISEIDQERIDSVEDFLTEGEQIPVKVLDVDSNGKIKLSRKSALEEVSM